MAAIDELIGLLEAEFRMTGRETGEPELSPEVATALRAVARERFVPEGLSHAAYDNAPLPIGHGQTISQPFIVALMTQLLHPRPEMVVLEVGTGSGYQAAVLSRLVARVHSTEVVPALAELAARRLAALGCDNVEVHAVDGTLGLPDRAPFDAIIATAAPERIPPALVEQLKPGGRMVIPVGLHPWGQSLKLVKKDLAGTVTERDLIPVAFVPMTGAGFP